jgi:hypothetical protein
MADYCERELVRHFLIELLACGVAVWPNQKSTPIPIANTTEEASMFEPADQ